MLIREVTTNKTTPPQTNAQARIASLQQSAERTKVAIKAERKQQQVLAAQKKLQKAVSIKV
jgi:hypothetical protein